MKRRSVLAALVAMAALPVLAQPVDSCWVDCGDTDQFRYAYDRNRVTNDSFYCHVWMRGTHKLTGQEALFQIEIQRRQMAYRTIGAAEPSFSSSNYRPIPPGSMIEAVFQEVKDAKRHR